MIKEAIKQKEFNELKKHGYAFIKNNQKYILSNKVKEGLGTCLVPVIVKQSQ